MGKQTTPDEDIAARTLGETLLPEAASWPLPRGRVLFLHARAATLRLVAEARDWTCVQGLRPQAAELEAWGHQAHAEPPDADSVLPATVLALPPRQRDLARACMARAVTQVKPGGHVRMAMANLEGARSGERDLRALMGTVRSESRHKCRVFGGEVDAGEVDPALLEAWLALDEPCEILGGRFLSRPGLFAWDRVDTASALLAEHLPDDLEGRLADLGSGYGYLACEALRRSTRVTGIDLYEADARALAPARENLRRTLAELDRDVPVQAHWHDVTRGVETRHDAVICNPPFHQGRADRPQLGQAFIQAAAGTLVEGGQLWLVANRHLPYEATLDRYFPGARRIAERNGFKVIHAVRGRVEAA